MARKPGRPGRGKPPQKGRRKTAGPAQGPAASPRGQDEPPPLAAEFQVSAARLDQAPADRGREVAFAGRSNAGKSSCLNRLTGRRSLARTSKTPGRTQLLNFFRIDDERRLVDLPGYGYAKTDRSTREGWQQHVEDYLARRQALIGLVLVMDVRHPFQPFDDQLIGWAASAALPTLVLLNKADKLRHGAAVTALRAAEKRLAEAPTVKPLLFSALRGTGCAEALALLREWLQLETTDPEPDPEMDPGEQDESA